jgi:hypothetical protein
MIRKTILVNIVQFLRKLLRFILYWISVYHTVSKMLHKYDIWLNIYWKDNYILDTFILVKQIRLTCTCFHIWVQFYHFHLHCYMVFSNGSGYYIFVLDDRFGCTDKREKSKQSIQKKLSYKMKDDKWWLRQTLVQIR